MPAGLRVIGIQDLVMEARQQQVPPKVAESVSAIVKGVKEGGDKALLDYTEKFDKIRLTPQTIRVGGEKLKSAYKSLPEGLMKAMVASAGRIRRFQEMQIPRSFSLETAPGVMVGVDFLPIQSVGIYIPGGTAAYPSSVLMTVIPAKVAGVERTVVFTPPGPTGEPPTTVMAAAHLAGVDELYSAGGAQAVAAMAYGTETIKKVEKIVGPGNIYVTAAKMLVSSDVAVDMIAGPSEVLIYAEAGRMGRDSWIAADILAQAEHDARARAILVTPSRELASSVSSLVEAGIASAPRKEILEKSISNAFAVVVKDRDEGIAAINEVAPEHLQIMSDNPEEIMKGVKNAGAIFLGDYSPAALGDYSAGTNHVLPTMGWAKRASPLSVRDFLRAREYVRCSAEGLRRIGPDAVAMANIEGLLNHARSIQARDVK